jgi:predicted DNA-binding transcriptional regulator YafY
MDVLRHGEQVRVVEPKALAEAVRQRLQRAVTLYTAV